MNISTEGENVTHNIILPPEINGKKRKRLIETILQQILRVGSILNRLSGRHHAF